MRTFSEMLNESLKGKEIDAFKYKVNSTEYTFTINDVKGELRLNINGGNKFLSKLDSKSIESAKEVLKGLVDKVGGTRFVNMMNRELEQVEASKNDTDWKVYSEFNNIRNNLAFRVEHRISGGKDQWKQEGKKYLGIQMRSKEQDVKDEIKSEVKRSKLKYVQGYNPLDEK